MLLSMIFLLSLKFSSVWTFKNPHIFQRSYRSCIYLAKGNGPPPKKFTKSNLPSKICVVCGRPFDWRKKWEKVWDEVKYCSERCRRNKGGSDAGQRSSSEFAPITTKSYRTFNEHLKRKYTTGIIKSAMIIATVTLPYDINSKTILQAKAVTTASYLSIKDIQESLDNSDEIDYDLLQRKSTFRRLDESSDTEFYKDPRLVEHIDNTAISCLISFHRLQCLQYAKSMNLLPNTLNILDICSSWVSHLPKDIYPPHDIQSIRPVHLSSDNPLSNTNIQNTIVGIGMNEAELLSNPQLSYYSVQDLNQNPVINGYIPDQLFDIVLLQLSIDYLIRPVEVLESIAKTMKKKGKLIISFSNRVFIDKAIAGWTGKSDIDHFDTIATYLRAAGRRITSTTTDSSSIGCYNSQLEGYNVLEQIKGKNYSLDGDPLYAIIATKI